MIVRVGTRGPSMEELALQVGGLLCQGALGLGLRGLSCYNRAGLIGLGWSAAAVLLLCLILGSKGLPRSP
jgi:hypothetical protein